MYNYAQLDSNNLVVGVSQLSGKIDSPNMILLETYDTSLLGATYDEESGEFVPAPPPKPVPQVPSEIDILGKQLAEKELQILQLQADTELFGQQLEEKDIQIMSLQLENEMIGQQIVDKDLRLIQVEADNEKMGQSIVNLELKLMNMEGK
ncbi:hypothetical protein D1872_102750 [compost metagenome]